MRGVCTGGACGEQERFTALRPLPAPDVGLMLVPMEKEADSRILCSTPDPLAPLEASDIRNDSLLRSRIQTRLSRKPLLDLHEVIRRCAIRVVVYTEDPNPVIIRAVSPG